MINLTVNAFRDDYQMISDWDTLCEMENFQIVRVKMLQFLKYF